MSENGHCGWAAVFSGLAGFGLALVVVVLAFIANDTNVGKKYQECIALGAPANNCLKKYVLPNNQKGE